VTILDPSANLEGARGDSACGILGVGPSEHTLNGGVPRWNLRTEGAALNMPPSDTSTLCGHQTFNSGLHKQQ